MKYNLVAVTLSKPWIFLLIQLCFVKIKFSPPFSFQHMKVVQFMKTSSSNLHFNLEQVKEKKGEVIEVDKLMLSFRVISMISYPTIICITSHSNSLGFFYVKMLRHWPTILLHFPPTMLRNEHMSMSMNLWTWTCE